MADTEFVTGVSGPLWVPKAKTTGQCDNCRFSVKEKTDLECHRLPPVASFHQMPAVVPTPNGPRQGMELRVVSAFPVMRPEQWCGEHKPK